MGWRRTLGRQRSRDAFSPGRHTRVRDVQLPIGDMGVWTAASGQATGVRLRPHECRKIHPEWLCGLLCGVRKIYYHEIHDDNHDISEGLVREPLVNVYKTYTAGSGWRAADGATQSQLDRSGTREERQLRMGNWLRPHAPRLLPLMRG